jgi:uncharacterized Zn-finger protein
MQNHSHVKLQSHLKVFTGEKLFSCSHCGKSFEHSHSLPRHLRVHTGEKPYSCSQCTKSFALKMDLQRHFRVYIGEKPYSYHQCSKTFASLLGCKHMNLFWGKPNIFLKCTKSFSRSDKLKRHINSGVVQQI